MRPSWFPLFLYVSTILLLTCLAAVEAEEEWTKEKKMEWLAKAENLKKANDAQVDYLGNKEAKDAEFKKKKEEAESAQATKKYIYYGVIGGGSVSGILNLILFILACKGIIFKPKRTEVNKTLDVL